MTLGERAEQLVALLLLVVLVTALALAAGVFGAVVGIGCALLGSILGGQPATPYGPRGDSQP